MLYNPKWGKPTKAKAFLLATLVAWLEQQNPKATYCYSSLGNCLFAQYFTACGFVGVSMGGWTMTHGPHGKRRDKEISDAWSELAGEEPHTFGAALKRARAIAG